MIKPYKKQLDNKSNPADFIRMFIIVREDIPYEHQLVQSCHAVGKYLLDGNPVTVPFNRDCHDRNCVTICTDDWDLDKAYDEKYVGEHFTWENGTMACLSVKDEAELLKWKDKLDKWGVTNSVFIEPDWIDREVPTALSCIGFRGDFATLKLVKMPVGFFSKYCGSEKLEIK